MRTVYSLLLAASLLVLVAPVAGAPTLSAASAERTGAVSADASAPVSAASAATDRPYCIPFIGCI